MKRVLWLALVISFPGVSDETALKVGEWGKVEWHSVQHVDEIDVKGSTMRVGPYSIPMVLNANEGTLEGIFSVPRFYPNEKPAWQIILRDKYGRVSTSELLPGLTIDGLKVDKKAPLIGSIKFIKKDGRAIVSCLVEDESFRGAEIITKLPDSEKAGDKVLIVKRGDLDCTSKAPHRCEASIELPQSIPAAMRIVIRAQDYAGHHTDRELTEKQMDWTTRDQEPEDVEPLRVQKVDFLEQRDRRVRVALDVAGGAGVAKIRLLDSKHNSFPIHQITKSGERWEVEFFLPIFWASKRLELDARVDGKNGRWHQVPIPTEKISFSTMKTPKSDDEVEVRVVRLSKSSEEDFQRFRSRLK